MRRTGIHAPYAGHLGMLAAGARETGATGGDRRECAARLCRDRVAADAAPRRSGRAGALRRGRRDRRVVPAGLEGARRARARAERRRSAPRRRRDRALPRRRRRLLRPARRGCPAVAARPRAARARRGGLGTPRGRARAARRTAQRDPRRPVRRAPSAARGDRAGGGGRRSLRTCARSPVAAPSIRSRCCCRRSISGATPAANGTPSPTACRRRRGWASPPRTGA